MKFFCFLLATALTTVATTATAEITVMDTPKAGTTLKLPNRSVSTFYTIDGEQYKVVVTFTAGSHNKLQPIKQIIQLTDGQTYRLSIGGYGDDKSITTLSMTRNKSRILAEVSSCEQKDSLANCL
jgi:hypothetical protein